MTLWGTLSAAARITVAIGVPNYDTYLAHMREKHPDKQALSYEAFFTNRMDARFGASNRRVCC